MTSYKQHFSHFLGQANGRLHFAAHSHHYWPDVTRAAQLEAWDSAAQGVDQKWDAIFGELIPSVQKSIADELGLSKPERIAFASNTHNFVLRLFSSFEGRAPVRVLSSDSEFHTFTRQCERYLEQGTITWDQVSTQPFESFEERFIAQLESGAYDLVFLSQVFFNSGYVFENLERLAAAMTASEALLVIDGYHGFMAIPTDLGPVEDRLFYMSGGYKYAMSGEGICFMHCPDGYALRPADTGWFASFGELEQSGDSTRVGYGPAGQRFWGATMDPSAFYRLHAVFRWLKEIQLDVPTIQAYTQELQAYFLQRLDAGELPWLQMEQLTPGPEVALRGRFLTFSTPQAASIHARLEAAKVTTDYRAQNLRFGFSIYQDHSDVDELCRRMQNSL
jgi:kynureninase